MKTLVVLVCTLLVAYALPAEERDASLAVDLDTRSEDCEHRYKQTKYLRDDDAVHTMCKYPSKSTSGGVSETDIRQILDKHNHYRKNLNIPETAAAMCLMYWDPEIATIAQHFADGCPTGHDKNNIVPGYGAIYGGQNLGWKYADWDAVINGWYSENTNFRYGSGAIDSDEDIGHYTQVVKDTACRVGCGFAICGGDKTFVCNYLTGQGNTSLPFVVGTPCSECPNTCVEGKLCDTKGKMCYHGTMDYKTNKCDCEDNYSGESCEVLTCDGTQGYSCGNSWPQSYCKIYSNVPYDCPIMCGRCKQDKTAGVNWIPAPAVTLKAGSVGTAGSFPAGQLRGPAGEAAAAADDSCAEDKGWCSWWLQESWCGHSIKFNGVWKPGREYCPNKCGAC